MFLDLSAAEIVIHPFISNAYMEKSKCEKNGREKASFVLDSTRPITF